MTANELLVILDRHKKWLNDEDGGSRADLCDAVLRGADLRGAVLRGAVLSDADLRGADLSDADLRGAVLRRAVLSDADLRGADLSDADLRGAVLRRAVLSDADLSDADLSDADLSDAVLRGAKELPDLPWTSIVPETGSFIGWKKVYAQGMSVIVKLEILADAKRCNATGRKCRCSAAKVLEIQKLDGTPAGLDSVVNTNYTPHVTYKVGETVLPDSFDDDRWNECSHGIHFFITRQEAVDY